MALIEHLEKLRHFHKLTQFSSINEAAANTGLSQAGLSKSLILLENELNSKLFNRSREGLTLTREGAELLEFTKKMLTEASALESRLRSLNATSAPKLIRMGMYDSIAVYLGVELQKYLKLIYPKVTMVLDAESSTVLFKKIQSKELDIAIGVNFPKGSVNSLKYYPLFDDYYSFYMASDLNTKPEDLPYLIHEKASDSSGETLGKILNKDLKNKIVHSVQNFETLKILTIQGLGIGVLPTQVARPMMSSGKLINAHPNHRKHLFGKHSIGFLVRAEIAETFHDFVEDIIRLSERWAKL